MSDLLIEPGSEEARLKGCICDDQHDRPAGAAIRVEKACPLHGLAELKSELDNKEESMGLVAPYTDIRIETPDISVYDLRQIPGLMTINLNPPSSGPEVELVFGTAEGADNPADEVFLCEEVERITDKPVLAFRRRGERDA